jgi:hypothetical protein
MYYMNTDRDNFHDWARDKPDTTSFSALQRMDSRIAHPPMIRWGRMLFLVAVAVALGVGLKYFVTA